jgi:hypothetical protein
MRYEQPVWTIQCGDHAIGYLYPCAADQPWVICRFEPAEGWHQVQQLFADQAEARRLGFPEDRVSAIKAVRDLGLKLERVSDGEIISPLLLYIEGDEAQFRA